MLYVCVCLLKFKTTAQSSICMCVKVHVSQFTSNLQHKVKNQIIITHRGCSVFVCCIVSFNFQWLRTLFHRWTYIIFFFSIVIKINKNCIFADFVASYRGTKLRKQGLASRWDSRTSMNKWKQNGWTVNVRLWRSTVSFWTFLTLKVHFWWTILIST